MSTTKTVTLTPRVSINRLLQTNMRLDWIEGIFNKFSTPGLPLDRTGASYLLSLSTTEPDALDLLWLFELISAEQGIVLVAQDLPLSPLGIDKNEEARVHVNNVTSELRELRSRYDAAERAIRTSGGATTARHAAAAHKHFVSALVGRALNTSPQRGSVHLAKAMHHSLSVKFAAAEHPKRYAVYGAFWDRALETVRDELEHDADSAIDDIQVETVV